jgi:phage recombination protein Bet
MLLEFMADKYSLNPDEFSRTVRATCGLSTATPEQVAAFLIVAKEYDLNPLTKEIYALPGKGGGIVPFVSIDGWVNLVNSHPQCDGFDFAVTNDSANELYSMTCTMYRKDRSHPTVVTEYFEECKRVTEPWKMKRRMLRHKAFMQAARLAFGFAGIYDEDEANRIVEAQVVQVSQPAAPARPAVDAGKSSRLAAIVDYCVTQTSNRKFDRPTMFSTPNTESCLRLVESPATSHISLKWLNP